MNGRQKEILQAQLNNEKQVLKELQQVFKQAIKDCSVNISQLSTRTDMENIQAIIYQQQYQNAIRAQLETALAQLQSGEYATISDYLTRCYQNGYVGAIYDIAGQGIPLIVPIDQNAVLKALQIDSKLSKSLYDRLGEDVKQLKTSIRAEVSRGVSNGSSWNEIGEKISLGMNSTIDMFGFNKAKNNSIRIARTEGHRIQNQSAMDAQEAAKKKGADVLKQWCAALDGNTRPAHAQADGQIKELDEYFIVGGEKMKAPGIGGSAANVCNCRCALLQRARWALNDKELDTLKERAEYFGLDKSKDFEEYKAKYLQLSEHVREDARNMNDEEDYLQSKKVYDKEVEHVRKLEKENDNLMRRYMDAMDTPDADRFEKLFNKSYDELESAKDILKDLRSILSGKEAKAVRHIEKNLANITGIPLNKVNMVGIPYESAKTIYESYNIVLGKYPELKGNLTEFNYIKNSTKKSYAGCITMKGSISAYRVFSNYDNLIKMYSEDVEKGFHPIGTDYRSIIVHELGHALDGYMTKKKLLGADYNQYGTLHSASQTAKNMTLQFLGFNRQEIIDELQKQGLTRFEKRDILKQKEYEFISERVSGYATGYDSKGNKLTEYPEREFFAECFAEYVMSDNPREAARIFGEIIDKALGR